MPNDVQGKVVTFKSMMDAVTNHEGAVTEAANKKAEELGEPWKQAAMMKRIGVALDKMEEREEVEGGPNVMTSPQDALASIMQARMAESGSIDRALAAGGHELKFDNKTDVLGWAWSFLSEWDADHHEIVRPASDDPETIPDDFRIAMFSDWGTGMYGAPVIAKTIEAQANNFDLVMHLGDVYYAGAEQETKERFLDLWPKCPNAISRALNGNHEMYSGGHAYFEKTLPAFRQKSSYFAYQNNNWLIACLDTACTDFDLDETQAAWLEQLVGKADERRVMVMSHHQLFSQLDSQGPKLADTLAKLLHYKSLDFWYWGHEHRCVVYDVDEGTGLTARCVGHSGMPQRRGDEKTAPSEIAVGNYNWRRLPRKATIAPSALILDGQNDFIKGDEDKYSPHGYVTLHLSGKNLHEEYHLPGGEKMMEKDL